MALAQWQLWQEVSGSKFDIRSKYKAIKIAIEHRDSFSPVQNNEIESSDKLP